MPRQWTDPDELVGCRVIVTVPPTASVLWPRGELIGRIEAVLFDGRLHIEPTWPVIEAVQAPASWVRPHNKKDNAP